MEATCWSDYLCPWCYLGQHRDGLMAGLGVTVVHRPFELHPEIDPEGRSVRPDGRLRTTFERVEAECATIDMAFRRPSRMPNTRRALATAEWVRVHHPASFDAVHRDLFRAQFVTGDALDDTAVLARIVGDAGAPVRSVTDAVADGRASELVDDSMTEARSLGVTSTPSWVLGDGLVIPGALDPDTMTRWVSKVVARRPA